MTDQMPAVVQSLSPGDLVDLFEVDLTAIGFPVVKRWTSSARLGQSLWFGGNEYVATAINVTGFKKNSDGTAVNPELHIPNVDKGGSALVRDYKGFIGAKVTRIRTFAQFLDFLEDGVTTNPDADNTTHMLPEIWYVEQKTNHNRTFLTFELSSLTDLQGKKIPKLRIWADLCERTYRIYDPDAMDFIYTNVNCPYVGTDYFDINGTPTTAANDNCGQDFKHCELRFPDDDLPGWFFPGLAKVSV